jgi:hypothetical protein
MAAQTHVIDSSQRSAAKVAALAYLIPVVFVLIANFGLRAGLYARGDIGGTIRRIADAEGAFRLSIGFDILYCLGVGVLLAALYRVFAPVNRHLALTASVLKGVYGISAVLMVLSYLTAVRLATDPVYRTMPVESLHALFRLAWASPGSQYYVGLVFWAVSATIFACLWLRSRYIPAPLAWFGILASGWCTVCALTYIIYPGFTRYVNLWAFDTPFALFDIALSVWLLAKGLRAAPMAVPLSA